MPRLLHRASFLKLLVGIERNTDVLQSIYQAVVVGTVDFEIGFRAGFGGQITAEPTEVRAVGIARLVFLRVMNAMRNDVTLFAKTDRVRPKKETRPGEMTESKCAMRAITMVPNSIVMVAIIMATPMTTAILRMEK